MITLADLDNQTIEDLEGLKVSEDNVPSSPPKADVDDPGECVLELVNVYRGDGVSDLSGKSLKTDLAYEVGCDRGV